MKDAVIRGGSSLWTQLEYEKLNRGRGRDWSLQSLTVDTHMPAAVTL